MSTRILVVDDSDTSLFLIQAILEDKEGVEILLESDGQKALDQLSSSQPDLIILDLLMPELDGFEFLKQAKANPQTRKVPVLVLTALQERYAEEKAMGLGAAEYIYKPLEINELEEKIHHYL